MPRRGSARSSAAPLINYKCSPPYRDWLTGFARSEGCTVSDLTEHSLRRYAVERNYPLPPIRLASPAQPAV